MKNLLFFILFFSMTASSAKNSEKTITCKMQGLQSKISFVVPNKQGALPDIDFSYPVKTIIFNLNADNLLVVAMDQDEVSRPRIFISAKANNNKTTYEGQFMLDSGGNQLQLDNGFVACQLK